MEENVQVPSRREVTQSVGEQRVVIRNDRNKIFEAMAELNRRQAEAQAPAEPEGE